MSIELNIVRITHYKELAVAPRGLVSRHFSNGSVGICTEGPYNVMRDRAVIESRRNSCVFAFRDQDLIQRVRMARGIDYEKAPERHPRLSL